MEREAAVREAFLDQAHYCRRLGSPFTARLCELLSLCLTRSDPVGARLLDWPGNPDATADGVPLRLCGALHALARSGTAPELARLYPPADAPEDAELRAVLEQALDRHAEILMPWLERAPQTNEVGRSAVLMAGLAVIADRFPMPVRLWELGASAGLNLLLDRYGHGLGGRRFGEAASPLQFVPEWTGPPPPEAKVEIAGRAGVDLAPADPVAERERLIAYIWPDQPKRLRQVEQALAIAAMAPPRVERGDAADWLERELPLEPTTGSARVVLHSVAYQYFPETTRRRLASHIDAAGAAASDRSPVAWLRLEKEPDDPGYSLRLRTWPGEDRLLAWVQPHGARIDWLTGSGPPRR